MKEITETEEIREKCDAFVSGEIQENPRKRKEEKRKKIKVLHEKKTQRERK